MIFTTSVTKPGVQADSVQADRTRDDFHYVCDGARRSGRPDPAWVNSVSLSVEARDEFDPG